MSPPQYPTLDDLILGTPPGTLLTPICAKEVFVLRTLGTRWQDLTRTVVAAHKELMEHPTAFGGVDFKMYVTRKYTQDQVVGTLVQQLDLPPDFFTWPLSK